MQCRDLKIKPLRIALVGCGRWGSCIATTIAGLPEYDLAWVCDPDVRWPNTPWAPELTVEVCRDVEAVLIATPPDAHCEPALRALAQGLAVFIEKPFTTSAQQAAQISVAAGNGTLMVGHLLVFHPLYARLLSDLSRGALGALRHIEVTRHSPSRGVPRCPWWTLAPHDLSLLVRLLGKPQNMKVQYAANARDVDAELIWGDVRANLEYSTTAPSKHRKWRLETTRTTLELDESHDCWLEAGRRMVVPTTPTPLALELLHFAECVARGETPVTGIVDALQNVELLCWGQRSLSRSQRHSITETVQDNAL